MQTEIKIGFDLSVPTDVEMFNAVAALLAKRPQTQTATKPEKAEKPTKAAETAEPSESGKAKPEAAEKNGGLELEDIRQMVSDRAKAGHRDAIKSKLTELGADNTSKLDPAHWDAFVEFLKGLKA